MISANQVLSGLKEGTKYYVILTHLETNKEGETRKISMMKEFLRCIFKAST